jgi:hypothetical protein
MAAMSEDIKTLLIVVTIAVIIAVVIFNAMRTEKRRKAILAWCQANGLQFDAARSDDPGAEFSMVAMMRAGHNRYGDNWCTGMRQGRQLCCFDYHYTTGSGNDSTTYNISVMTIESARPLKPLTVRPEGLLDKVGEFFGGQDIHFESDEFNRRFHVKCEDRKWAYDVMPPRAMELLLAGQPNIHVQYDTKAVVVWDGELWQVEGFDRAARLASGLLDLIPQFAAQETV